MRFLQTILPGADTGFVTSGRSAKRTRSALLPGLLAGAVGMGLIFCGADSSAVRAEDQPDASQVEASPEESPQETIAENTTAAPSDSEKTSAAVEKSDTEPQTAADQTDEADDGNTRYELRYRFQTGEFVRYEVSDSYTMTTRKGRFQESLYNRSDVTRHYRVVSVDDQGEAVLELMIDRVRLTAQFDDAPPTIFDSSDPDQQPPKFQSILASVGKPMSRMRVSSQGEMLGMQNLQGGPATGLDPAQNFLLVFPEKAVEIGETWKQTLEIEVPVTARLKEKMNLLRTYTLEKVEEDVATIGMVTVLTKPVRDPAIKTRLLQQTPSGTIQFDMKRQQLISRELRVNESVIGAFGAETLVEARGLRTERKVETRDTAQREPKSEAAKLSQSK